MLYRVIDADGREHGPVDIEALKEWAYAGRVRRDTKLIDAQSGVQFIAGSVAALGHVFASVATEGTTDRQPATPGSQAAQEDVAARVERLDGPDRA